MDESGTGLLGILVFAEDSEGVAHIYARLLGDDGAGLAFVLRPELRDIDDAVGKARLEGVADRAVFLGVVLRREQVVISLEVDGTDEEVLRGGFPEVLYFAFDAGIAELRCKEDRNECK